MNKNNSHKKKAIKPKSVKKVETRGGARPNAGRKEKVYSETLIEKKLLIPQSKYQYFTDLAKSERAKVFLHYVEKN